MQSRLWDDEGMRLAVSVNISPRQLADPHLTTALKHALTASHAEPGRLCLEITESAAVDAGAPTLAALRQTGVRLALDDFGAGFSSLHQIRRLPPVDALKIDRSFVEDLRDGSADIAIVAAVVGMARALGMVTVAEGIHNEAQVQILRALGCIRGQGYYFGRPVAPAGIADLAKAASFGELLGTDDDGAVGSEAGQAEAS
jgi:EAL domain-containing protein (putative c-di-GMP-specific phosphodiesterase class I)